MAGIENLKKRILKDDEEKAKQIENDAVLRARDIVKKAEDKAKTILEDAKIKAEKDGISSMDRIIARAELDARNMVLAAKQEIIGNILDLARESINNMDSKEYTDFIHQLLLSSAETGEEEVIFSEKDKKRIESGLIVAVNAELKAKGKKGALKVSGDTRNIESGFVLKQGGVEINCSIDSQIRMLRDSIEGELAGLLFQSK